MVVLGRIVLVLRAQKWFCVLPCLAGCLSPGGLRVSTARQHVRIAECPGRLTVSTKTQKKQTVGFRALGMQAVRQASGRVCVWQG